MRSKELPLACHVSVGEPIFRKNMRTEVMYRDLPGGPLVVKFADEVSLWCLCSKCGMFSKDMFQDSASHVFCSVCVFECSERKMIHCKHERKDVPVDDMVQAAVVCQVMSDQIVFCPNGQNGDGCKKFCALKDLKVHYLKCAATEINCLSCGSIIKGSDWEEHINTCPQKILQCRYCALALPRETLQKHEERCYDNQEARLQPRNTAPVSDSSVSSEDLPTQKESKATWNNAPGIGTPVVEAQPISTNVKSDDILDQCIYCKRNVKRKNMERHNEICPQNKKQSTVSAVENVPGGIEAEDTLQSSLLWRGVEIVRGVTTMSCDTLKGVLQVPAATIANSVLQFFGGVLRLGEDFEGADPETSSWKCDGASLKQQTTTQSSGGVQSYDFGSDPMKTETAEGSAVVPGVTSSSSAANRHEDASFHLSWPPQPSHRRISDWFDLFEAWLERNGMTAEEQKFPLLLNKIPEVFAHALLVLHDEPYPYSAAKFNILHNFKRTDGVI